MIVTLIGIAIIIFVGGFLFFKLTPQKNSDGNEIEISLDELSQVWLKYNQQLEPVSTPLEPVDYNEEEGVIEKLIKNEEEKVFESSQTSVESKENDNQQPLEKVEQASALTENIDMIALFYKDVIKPYEGKFKEQNVYDVLLNILKMLDKHGSVPSVVIDTKDSESIDVISVRSNLAMVTLKEHTLTVARIIERLAKQNQIDYENFMPQYLITALSHDIGKIPELRVSGVYNSYDHSIVSSNWLMEQFVGKDVFWAKQAVVAVRDHHLKSREPLTQLLREADKQARQMELIRYASQYEVKDFNKWFNLEEFTKKYLEPEINVTQKNKWEAFSLKGIIYIRPDLLYELTKKYAYSLKVLDATLFYESEKEEVLKKVIQKYREKQLVPDFIGEGYFSRKCEIKTKISTGKKQVFVLTAIKGDLIDLPKVEARKQGSGFIEMIEAVIPQ